MTSKNNTFDPLTFDINTEIFKIVQLSTKQSEDKVENIFKESKIESWLKNNRGDTYFRIKLELKPAAERMFFYEFKEIYLDRIRLYLIKESNCIGEEAGKLKANLKPWEILYADSWKFSQTQSKGKPLKNSKNSWTLSFSFLNLATQNVFKTFLSFVISISLVIMFSNIKSGDLDFNNSDLSSLIKIFSILSGVSIVHILSMTVYNWSLVEENKLLDQKEKSGCLQSLVLSKFSWLLILIWFSESVLGYEAVSILRTPPIRVDQQVNVLEPFFIGLGTSIFALVNILFAISKAKRDKSVEEIKKSLLSLLEKRRDLDNYIEDIGEEIYKANISFSNYKDEYTALIREDNGILFQVSRLSKYSYENTFGKIPVTEDQNL